MSALTPLQFNKQKLIAAVSNILVLQFHDISIGNDADYRLVIIYNGNGTEAIAGKQFGSLFDRAFRRERHQIGRHLVGEALRWIRTQKLLNVHHPEQLAVLTDSVDVNDYIRFLGAGSVLIEHPTNFCIRRKGNKTFGRKVPNFVLMMFEQISD